MAVSKPLEGFKSIWALAILFYYLASTKARLFRTISVLLVSMSRANHGETGRPGGDSR
jgi:hypothetical protein